MIMLNMSYLHFAVSGSLAVGNLNIPTSFSFMEVLPYIAQFEPGMVKISQHFRKLHLEHQQKPTKTTILL